MTKATRFGICGLYGALAAALSLGPATYALAWDQPQWVRQLGTTDIDEAYGVATDTDGNVYLTGDTSGSLGRPNQSGYYDAWVAKYSAAGALRWKRQLGTANYDFAYGVATDADGNVYLTGYTFGSLGGPNQGATDAWVAKYSAAGALRWKRQLGTANYDFAYGVATDADGNVYLTGYTTGSLGGPHQGGYDAWVAKYSAAGGLRWKRQLGTAVDDWAYGVATDADGNVYLTGETNGSLGGPNQGDNDAWVAKYSVAGALRWKRQLGTAGGDGALGVATDTDGNVYLTGVTNGSLGGPNQGDNDAWVAKYSAVGGLRWKRQLGTAVDDGASGVATDTDGNVYLTGTALGSLGGPNQGNYYAWVAQYSAAGALGWKRQLGAADDTGAGGVATDADGNVYLTGTTLGSLGGPNQGSYDAWVAKYTTGP